LAEALMRYEALAAQSHADATLHAGIAALQLGQLARAGKHFTAVLERNPDDLTALANLGAIHARTGRLAEAERLLSRALARDPDNHDARVNLANVVALQGDLMHAERLLRQTLGVQPEHVEALTNLGRVLADQRRTEAAAAALMAALRVRPQHATAHLNLANVSKDVGKYADAARHYASAVALRPRYAPAWSASLLAACYDPELTAEAQFAAARRFAATFEGPPREVQPAGGARQRLRVGLVSADFRQHACLPFLQSLLPLLAQHAIDPILYANQAREDAATAQLREHAAHFASVLGEDDPALAERIARDRVDVLIDLSGHTAGNRLPAFAQRLAPVQVSWLGYLGSTGLARMDYRFTDAVADPAGAEAVHSESLVRLPTLCAFTPPEAHPPTSERRDAAPTFGFLGNPAKLNAAVLRLWGEVLADTPDARLILHAHPDQAFRARLAAGLHAGGAQSAQLVWQAWLPRERYLALWHEIDVALDAFPYSGGVTVCDALAAGVPVVAARFGAHRPFSGTAASLLTAAGASSGICTDPAAYRECARALIADRYQHTPAARAARQAALRQSQLVDAAAFARSFADALWLCWRGQQ
jgi:predicted O-linked N-acetylglucosamine transferase (SPINDLY family)